MHIYVYSFCRNADIKTKFKGFTRLYVLHNFCQTWYSLTLMTVKGQKRWGLNTIACHKPYKFDLVVKGQGRIRIMNVLDISSHDDWPMCQIWYADVKTNRSYRSDMKTWQKPIKLTWRSKVNIESGSWMYTTHPLMVKHPCAKYGKPMSNQKNVMGRTQICTDRRTDRKTDRQSDFYISPLTLFTGGIIRLRYLLMNGSGTVWQEDYLVINGSGLLPNKKTTYSSMAERSPHNKITSSSMAAGLPHNKTTYSSMAAGLPPNETTDSSMAAGSPHNKTTYSSMAVGLPPNKTTYSSMAARSPHNKTTYSSMAAGSPQDFPPGSPWPVWIKLFFKGLLMSFPVNIENKKYFELCLHWIDLPVINDASIFCVNGPTC